MADSRNLKIDTRWFIGQIENVHDPDKKGMVQVRVQGVHDPRPELLPTKYLPWAKIMVPATEASRRGVGRSPTGVFEGCYCAGIAFDEAHTDLKILHTWHNHDDIHILARNDNEEELQNSVVGHKKEARDTGIPTFDGGWDEPEIPYAAEYPWNDVTVSRGGHVKEVDNTPGAERLHELHVMGTFREIHPDGSSVTKVVGDDYVILQKDHNMAIFGNCNLTVFGDATTYIKGNRREKVDGDEEIIIKGNRTVHVHGNETTKVDGNSGRGVGGNNTIATDGNLSESIGGSTSRNTSGSDTRSAGGTMHDSASNIHHN